MKPRKINYKIEFNIGDLIVDTESVKTGLVVAILKNHIKVLWDESTEKISIWEANNKINLQKTFQYFPRKKNSRK